MDITILEEKENLFFKRKEMTLLIKHPKSSTPKKLELIKELALRNSVDETQVKIEYIFGKKGSPESIAKIKILKEKSAEAEKKNSEKEILEKGEKIETQTSQSS